MGKKIKKEMILIQDDAFRIKLSAIIGKLPPKFMGGTGKFCQCARAKGVIRKKIFEFIKFPI
jgi:hypothetical protein